MDHWVGVITVDDRDYAVVADARGLRDLATGQVWATAAQFVAATAPAGTFRGISGGLAIRGSWASRDGMVVCTAVALPDRAPVVASVTAMDDPPASLFGLA